MDPSHSSSKKFFFEKLDKYLSCFFQYFCPFLHRLVFSEYEKYKLPKTILSFIAGFALGQMYFFYLFKDISSLSDYVHYISLFISVLLGKYVFSYKTFHLQVIKFAQYFQGVSNAVLIQVRCILCLLLPMYCGKSGRGVLKAVVLSYVVAGKKNYI